MNYTRHISNVPINRYCIWNVWMHLHCWSRWMLVDASVVCFKHFYHSTCKGEAVINKLKQQTSYKFIQTATMVKRYTM